MGQSVRTIDAALPVVYLAQHEREGNREALNIGQVSTDNSVECQHRFDLIVFKILVKEIVDGQGAVRCPEKFRFFLYFPGCQGARHVIQIDRCTVHKRGDHHGLKALDLPVKTPEGIGILFTETSHRSMGFFHVRVDGHRCTIFKDRTHLHRRVSISHTITTDQI